MSKCKSKLDKLMDKIIASSGKSVFDIYEDKIKYLDESSTDADKKIVIKLNVLKQYKNVVKQQLTNNDYKQYLSVKEWLNNCVDDIYIYMQK